MKNLEHELEQGTSALTGIQESRQYDQLLKDLDLKQLDLELGQRKVKKSHQAIVLLQDQKEEISTKLAHSKELLNEKIQV